jgi:type II secretory pathway pseudopilin PulG
MKIKCATRAKEGTTLVEVVFAMVVLAIMGAALAGSYTFGFMLMQMARENQRATQIMLEKVETLRLYRWDQVLTPGFIPTNFTEVYDPQASGSGQGVTYTGTVSIAQAPFSASYSTNMRQLVVTLQWATGNVNRIRSLATLIARDGVQNYVY